MKTITFAPPVHCPSLSIGNAFITNGRRVLTAYTRAPGRIGSCKFDDLSLELTDPRYGPATGEPHVYVQRHIADRYPHWQPLTPKAHEEFVRQVANAVRGDFAKWFIEVIAERKREAGPDCRVAKLRAYAAWIEHQDAFALEVAQRLADGTVELRKRPTSVTTVAERDDRNVTMVSQREMRTTYGTKCFDIVANGEVIGWYTTEGEAVSAYSPPL